MRNGTTCCNQECQRGRICPKRTDRRQHTPLLWRWFGWLLNRRSGRDRRKNGAQ